MNINQNLQDFLIILVIQVPSFSLRFLVLYYERSFELWLKVEILYLTN